MIFGGARDTRLLTKISRELLGNIIEQEILYYKPNLEESSTNIYGESLSKTFWVPVRLTCLITRGDQVITEQEYGPDLDRTASFAFIREDLVDVNTVPEVGDIVEWHNSFYQVDVVRENQLFVGKDQNYSLTDYGFRYGNSVSIIVDCHMTRGEKLGIRETI